MFKMEDLIRETSPVQDKIFITENDYFEGYTISEYKKIIWASLFLKMPDMANYIEIVNDSREKIYNQIIENAKSIGANAIINLKFNTLKNKDNIELSITGTAVKIIPIPNYIPSGDRGILVEKVLKAYTKKEKESAKQAKSSAFGLI